MGSNKTDAWGISKWGMSQTPTVLSFTNTGTDITPYIVVNGSPDILWTWNDGSADTRANPDDKTLTGTHTLSVDPWSDLTDLRFNSQSLTGSFVTQPWVNIVNLYCHSNSLSNNFITFPWVKLEKLYLLGNSFSGSLTTYPWTNLVVISCGASLFSGSFTTYPWPNAIVINCNDSSFSGTLIVHPWINLENLYCGGNSFASISGSFQTQIKMTNLTLSYNAITSQSEIDKILSDLVVNAADAGRSATCTVKLEGGTNATPSAAGQADAEDLRNTYGWTVTTN